MPLPMRMAYWREINTSEMVSGAWYSNLERGLRKLSQGKGVWHRLIMEK